MPSRERKEREHPDAAAGPASTTRTGKGSHQGRAARAQALLDVQKTGGPGRRAANQPASGAGAEDGAG